MSQNQGQGPLDMNAAFKDIAMRTLAESAPQLVGETLVSAGNSLRLNGYGMMKLEANMFLTTPAVLDKNVTLWLTKFYRPIPNFFNLFVAHTPDGQRTFAAVLESEGDTIQSKFLQLTPEMEAELNRQLDALNSEYKGTFHLGLFVQEQLIDGYQYFTTEEQKGSEAQELKTDTSASNDTGGASTEDTQAIIPDAPQAQAQTETGASSDTPAVQTGDAPAAEGGQQAPAETAVVQ